MSIKAMIDQMHSGDLDVQSRVNWPDSRGPAKPMGSFLRGDDKRQTRQAALAAFDAAPTLAAAVKALKQVLGGDSGASESVSLASAFRSGVIPRSLAESVAAERAALVAAGSGGKVHVATEAVPREIRRVQPVPVANAGAERFKEHGSLAAEFHRPPSAMPTILPSVRIPG